MQKSTNRILLYLIIFMFLPSFSQAIQDHQFSLLGSKMPGENKDFTLSGELILNARSSRGFLIQGAGKIDIQPGGNHYGFSAGLGYETGSIGCFLFTDGLLYGAGNFRTTFHLQIRPTLRIQFPGFRGTLFYAKGIGDQYTGVNILHEEGTTIAYYNKSLSYFGMALESQPLKGSYLKMEALYAPGNIYRLNLEKEFQIWGGLCVLVQYRKANFGDFPNLALQGFSKGSRFGLGIRYRFGGGVIFRNIKTRSIVPVFYPLVATYEKNLETEEPLPQEPPSREKPLTITLAGEPMAGQAPLRVNFTATTGGGCAPFKYRWFFLEEGGNPVKGSRKESHTFYLEGCHEVYVEVEDSLGKTATSAPLHIEVNTLGKHTIQALAHQGSQITPTGTILAENGGNYLFKISAGTGYKIARVEVDGKNKGVISEFCFNNVEKDHRIEAWGKIDDGITQYRIISKAGTGGTNDPQGTLLIDEGGAIKINILPNPGYTVKNVLVDGISMGPRGELTLENVTKDHTVESIFQVSHFNITALQNPGGTISPQGTSRVNRGENLSYTITREPGQELTGLLIDGLATTLPPSLSYTFLDTQRDHTIEPLFGQQTLTITATSEGKGTLADTGAILVVYGESKTFHFTPQKGWEVTHVLVDGNHMALPRDGTYTFTQVTTAHSLHIIFKPKSYTITAINGKGGHVEPGTSIVPWGDDITFQAIPLDSHEIANVKIDGASYGIIKSYTFEKVESDHILEAIFKVKTFEITVTLDPGSICTPGSTQVSYGEGQKFLFSAGQGKEISDVIIDGISKGDIGSWHFDNIKTDHSIQVLSKNLEFTINETHETGARVSIEGQINPGEVKVTWGDRVTCNFDTSSSSGKNIENVTIDGTARGKISFWTFEEVKENHQITVETQWKYYRITSSAGPGGAINPVGDQIVRHGDSTSFIIQAQAGYMVDSLIVDNSPVNPADKYTFSNVSADHTIHCTFKTMVLPKFQVIYGGYDFDWQDNTLVPNQGTGGGGPVIQEQMEQGETFQFTYPAWVKDPTLPVEKQFEIPFQYVEINGRRSYSRTIILTLTKDTIIRAYYQIDRNI